MRINADPGTPEQYSQVGTSIRATGYEFITLSTAKLTPPCVDVGCGEGELTNEIAKHFGIEITGIDNSTARIQYAQQHFSDGKFQIGNATELNKTFAAGTFNTLVSFSAIHHIPEKLMQQTFNAFYHVLGENGVAFISTFGKETELHAAIDAVASSEKWCPRLNRLKMSDARTYKPPSYYHSKALNAGFSAVVTAEKTIYDSPKSFEEFKEFLSAFLPHLAILKEKNADETELNNLKLDIATLYFAIMGKKEDETVTVKHHLNGMMLFKSAQALRKYCPALPRAKL